MNNVLAVVMLAALQAPQNQDPGVTLRDDPLAAGLPVAAPVLESAPSDSLGADGPELDASGAPTGEAGTPAQDPSASSTEGPDDGPLDGSTDGPTEETPDATTAETAVAAPQSGAAGDDAETIDQGLPAQVLADLARQALQTPENEQAWSALEEAAAASTVAWWRPVLEQATRIATRAGTAAKQWSRIGWEWARSSAATYPRAWVGGLALAAVSLIGLRARRDRRHRASTPVGVDHWKARRRARRRARRGFDYPRAGVLLGRGVPAREVARQTGLSRDLVGLVRFQSGEPPVVDTSQLVIPNDGADERQGGSSAPGTFTRAHERTADERAASVISVIA